jgi:hypothetical protein
MLLIDMYEQWVAGDIEAESGLADLPEPQVQRAIRWRQKLRPMSRPGWPTDVIHCDP